MTAVPERLRHFLHTAMAVIGAAIVALTVVLADLHPLPALTVTVGAVLFYVGMASIIRARPKGDRRANRVLRSEIDGLISLTRDLYQYRTRGDAAMIHETKAHLREALERIIKAASLYQEEQEKTSSQTAANE